MNRRILVAAVTAIGVLVVGVGTASAATSTGLFAKKACPVYSSWDGKKNSPGPWHRRHIPRECLPTSKPPEMTIPRLPTTKKPDVTIPRTPGTINCIKAPCCPVNKLCIPEYGQQPPAPLPTPSTVKKPTPDVTIEPWLQNPPIYCPMVASVDTQKVPQKVCGCPTGGTTADARVAELRCAVAKPDVSIMPAPKPVTKPDVSIMPAPPKSGPTMTIATAPKTRL
jgi:hypothetical protein